MSSLGTATSGGQRPGPTPSARPHEVATGDDFLALAQHGRLSLLRELLSALDASSRSERLKAVDEYGNTALLLAIGYEYPNVAALLLKYPEADPLHKNARGHTALSLAARSKRPYIISSVLSRLLGVDRLERGELVTFPMLSQILLTPTVRGGGAPREAFARHTLIDLYCELGIDQLSLCVVGAFKQLPATCLYDVIEMAAALQLRSRSVREYDSFRSDELEAASARMQLAAAGCLMNLGKLKDRLGRFEVEQLLKSPRGEAAIKLAIRHSCKQFLSQPPVQAFLTSEWHGPLLHHIFEAADGDLSHLASGCFVWVLVLVLNLLLLPFLAAAPPLERRLVGLLKRDAAEQLVARAGAKMEQLAAKAGTAQADRPSHGREATVRSPGPSWSCLPVPIRPGPSWSAPPVPTRTVSPRSAGSSFCSHGSRALSPSPSPPQFREGSPSPSCADSSAMCLSSEQERPERERKLPSSHSPLRRPSTGVLLSELLPPASRPASLAAAATRPSTQPRPTSSQVEVDDLTTKPPWLHYYLLRVPMLKFMLRLVSDVALALFVTFEQGEPSPLVFLSVLKWDPNHAAQSMQIGALPSHRPISFLSNRWLKFAGLRPSRL